MKNLRLFLILFIAAAFIISCTKEQSTETGGNGGGGGTGGGGTTTCNGTTQKLKSFRYLHDTSEYINLAYNSQGQISSIRYKMMLSEYFTATYVYENNRIASAILRRLEDNSIVDTVIYHYNPAGKMDSAHCKVFYSGILAFNYDANGRLKKLSRLNPDRSTHYYADLQHDSRGNIIRADTYLNDGNGGFEKLSKYDYVRDDKSNPFADFAMYMFFLDDEEDIFQLYGPNNNTDETFLHYSNSATATTGFKFTYVNCYPSKAKITFYGQPILNEDAYEFVY